MARWVPDDRDGLDKLIATIVDMFADAELSLIQSLAIQARAGLASGKGPEDALNLTELRRDAIKVVEALSQSYPDEIASIAAAAVESGAGAALQEMSALADVQDLTSAARLPGSPAAQAMTADLTNALDDVTLRVLRYPDDVYRRTIAQNAVKVTLGQATGHQAQQAAWNNLLDQRVTGFRDKAGRNWNMSSYTEMATRSATRRAWDDAHTDTMQENGISLVTIVVGSGSCKNCARWAGKILRTDSGPTGRIEIRSAIGDNTVTVNVAGNTDDAKSAGWRHPNCFPGWVPVESPTGIAAADSRWFDGDLVTIHTSGSRELSVTPNHPILTSNGWVNAGALRKGDNLIRYHGPVEGVPVGGPDHERGESTIGEVYETLRQASGVTSVLVPGAAEQFHGDGSIDSEVDVVLSDRLLGSDGQPARLEQAPEGQFLLSGVRLPSLLAARSELEVIIAAHHAANCVVSGTGEPRALNGVSVGHADIHSLASTADRDATTAQDSSDYRPGDTLSAGHLLDGLAGLVSSDEVVEVEERKWSGHVYNLQSGGGWYVASDYIVHNCRCSTAAYLPGLSAVADVTTYDPQAEADRAKLRGLERQVRASKIHVASALTPEDAKAANVRTRELQTRIREHVNATGLQRQRNREQINLDNRRA
jgi:hypothetical protein